MDHNYDETYHGIVALKNEKSLNCSVPFHPPTKSNVTGKYIKVCENSSLGTKAFHNTRKIFRILSQIPKYKPCTWIDTTLGLPEVNNGKRWKERAFLRLYFKSHFKIKSIISYYDLSSLIADIGGYTGMLLGISLIDLTVQFNNVLVRLITAKFKEH